MMGEKLLDRIMKNRHIDLFMHYFTLIALIEVLGSGVLSLLMRQDLILTRVGQIYGSPNEFVHALNVIWVGFFGLLVFYRFGWRDSIVYTFFLFVGHEVIWSYLFILTNFDQLGLWLTNRNWFSMMIFFTLAFIPFVYYIKRRKSMMMFLRYTLTWLAFTIFYFAIFGARVSILPIGHSIYFYDFFTNLYEIASVLIYTVFFYFFVKRIEKI